MKRTYGNDSTKLALTGKALEFYNATDPITITEEERDGELLYQVLSGNSPMHDGLMTEEKLIKWLEDGYYDAAVALMDDEIREAVHADLAPCSNAEFLAEYCRRHEEKFGEPFEI